MSNIKKHMARQWHEAITPTREELNKMIFLNQVNREPCSDDIIVEHEFKYDD